MSLYLLRADLFKRFVCKKRSVSRIIYIYIHRSFVFMNNTRLICSKVDL